MTSEQESFSIFLITFISIIFAIVAFEFLAGWKKLLKNRHRVRIDAVHLAWTILAFLFLLQNWWGLWRYREAIGEGFLLFLFRVVNPIGFYISTIYLFPEITNELMFNCKEYFLKNAKVIFYLFAALLLKFSFDSVVMLREPVLSKTTLIRFAAIPIVIVGGHLGKERYSYHKILIVALTTLFIIFILIRG